MRPRHSRTEFSQGDEVYDADLLEFVIDEAEVVVILCGARIMLLPAAADFLFGSLVLKMNPVLLLGAITGSMTSTPARMTSRPTGD